MFRIISNKCSSTRRWIPKFVRHKTKTTNLCEVKPGERIHGYTVQKVVPVPELYLTAVSLTHDKTGAHHLHVSREDTDNVFGVAFRTTPRDDTGVPHILEHTVLCGSQKYPVRDPFFKMLNRSLSTFMNAFTASDWTMYPFSSQNLQDYKNLMSVYLDAAFFPKLTEMDFRQEGWRLEHENIEDPTSPIIFKGIVFNEMKGVFSNSQNLFSQKAQNLLLPSHTYSTCSGGDPHSIPQLTWENLKNFHASHYHPSNSRFFTYGNFPLENHLEFIDKHALSKFSQIDPKTSVPLETKWNEKREAEIQCNPDPMCADPNKQTTVAVSYLLGDVTDPFETTMLSVLGYLLVGGEKSPFYQALIEANIGSDYAPEIGFDQSARNGRFSVGLQGIHQDDVEKVKTIIEETVDKVIKDGFERRELEAIFHKVELNRRHQSSKFGLQVGVNLMYSWIHDADPSEFLQSKKHIDDLKNHIKENPRYLQEKVQNYLKDNPHKLTLVMHANDKFEEKRQNEESILLQNMVSKLSAQDKETVYQKGIELAKIQSEDEDLSCLPTLKVSDIDPVAKTVEIQSVHVDGTPIQLCPQPTNGVTYFRALSSIADLPEDLKPYVPLFCSVVTKMGAGEMNFRELAQKINLKTGGLNVGTHVTSHHSDENLLEQSIMFSSYCLEENFTDMFQLWSDIFHSLNLSDSGRLKMLILMSAAELANSITGIGHSYAMSHAASSLSPASHYKEVFGGMSQVSLMKKVAELSDLTHVIQSLNDIARHSLNRHTMRCSINATPESISDACQKTEEFVKQLYHPNQEKKEKLDLKHLHFYNQEPNFTCKPHDTHFKLPFQVNYMARSVKTVPFTNPDFASLRVLSKLMTSKFLHREIREKGGAYGGGASGGEPGLFNFYSYRDPNSSNTLDAFDRAVKWACEGSYSTQDIDEAKLGIFQQVDMPVSPGEEGMRQFFFDINDSMRQSHREQLFDVNKASLINVAEKYLTEDKRVSSVAFLGPENPLSSDQKSWTVKN